MMRFPHEMTRTGRVAAVARGQGTTRTLRAAAATLVVPCCLLLLGCRAGEERWAAATHANDGAPADTVFVSAEWVAAHAANGDVLVIQVGSVEDYQAERIAGARLITLPELNEERDGIPNVLVPAQRLERSFEAAGVTGDERVVIYGAPLPAARAFVALERIGHPRASILDGGIAAWRAIGGAMESGPAAPAPAATAARWRHDDELVVDAEWVREQLAHADYVLLDARPPAEHSGETAGDRVPRPGHIPGSVNLFWEQLIVSREQPLLRSDDALRALFADAGARADRTIVTYCRTGMQSSFAYAVARHLGYETRIYDGSFVDWSRRRDLPVER